MRPSSPRVRPHRSLRIVLYAVNGTGLGHVTRLLAIARWLVRVLNGMNVEAQIYFLTCSDADSVIGKQGFASFKLPSRTVLRAQNLSSVDALDVIRRFAAATLRELDPDVLVVDTFPTGAYDELLPVLGDHTCRKVFVFREQRPEYARTVPYEALLSNYDLLLIPHPHGSFDLPFRPPGGLEVCWAGPIVFGEPDEAVAKRDAIRTLGLPPARSYVYASAGGGGDSKAAESLDMIRRVVGGLPDTHLVLGAGPLGTPPPGKDDDVTWTTYYPISRMFSAFDFAISSSGYNSVSEMLFMGLPAIFYGQPRSADDQEARAMRVERDGAGLALPVLTEDGLADAVRQMCDPARREAFAAQGRRLLPVNGARTAAEAVVGALHPAPR